MKWFYRIIGTLIATLWNIQAIENKPNIIIIYTDDQGYGDAGCYNPESRFLTPNIDRLASEGILFTDGHSSDTVCTPSRYGFLTGRYSWRTELKRGVFGAERKCLIPNERMTIASLLKSQGYQTAMVGKWHLGMDFPGDIKNRDWTKPVLDMPLDKGFDFFWGIPASMNYGVLAWFNGRYAAVPPTLYTSKKPNRIAISDYRIMPPYENVFSGQNKLEIAADFVDSECLTRFTDQAIEWIQSKSTEARKGNPFFLYLPYTAPHKPVIPIERFRGRSKAGAYGDFMMETDWHIGRLLKTLDEENLSENTMVFFSSDNGPERTWVKRIELYGHRSAGGFKEGKRSIYEGGHRVPFILRWPAQVQSGRTWNHPVCQTDLLATLAEMLEITLPPNAGEDSISFYPVLKGERNNPQRQPMIHHSANGRFAIRHGSWKLIMETPRNPRELYDLATDPGESTNLLDKYSQKAADLEKRISRIIRIGRTSTGSAVDNDTPPWQDLTWMRN